MWSKEIPTEEGFYWVYEIYTYRKFLSDEIEIRKSLNTARVLLCSNGTSISYQGTFFSKEEWRDREFYWMKMEIPSLPDEND